MNTLNSSQVDANLPGKISELFATVGGGNQLVNARYRGSKLAAWIEGELAYRCALIDEWHQRDIGDQSRSHGCPLIMGVLKKAVGRQNPLKC